MRVAGIVAGLALILLALSGFGLDHPVLEAAGFRSDAAKFLSALFVQAIAYAASAAFAAMLMRNTGNFALKTLAAGSILLSAAIAIGSLVAPLTLLSLPGLSEAGLFIFAGLLMGFASDRKSPFALVLAAIGSLLGAAAAVHLLASPALSWFDHNVGFAIGSGLVGAATILLGRLASPQ